MQTQEYRTRLEQFHEVLNRELYAHYSGLKPTLETIPVYSEYSDLFSIEQVREIQAEIDALPPFSSSRKKSFYKLRAFALEHHFEQMCGRLSEEIAEFESKTMVPWAGKDIPFTQVPLYLANEPDAAKRRGLNQLRSEALENSNSLRIERIRRVHAAVHGLGYRNYVEACEATTGIDYHSLLTSMELLVESTQEIYRARLADSFQRDLGLAISQAHRCDVGYWTRRRGYDQVFRKELLIPSLFETLSGLGIDPVKQSAVVFDLEDRPQKHARAFCAPLRIPHEIRVVLQPRGGQDDFSALLHEAGHAQHFAWTSPELAPEYRLFGDRAVSETYAFLLEHLQSNEAWLRSTLGFQRSAEFISFQALARTHLIRRYCGKLTYEVQLHEKGLTDAPEAYADTLLRSTGIQYDPQPYLEDVDDALYSADYLRAWVFEAQLREYLRSRFGNRWFQQKACGNFLKEIWETGQLYSIDELSREIGIGNLDPQALTDDLVGTLRR